jgi:ATP-dependent Clp protease ATP-binding subunit ClpB
MLEGSAIAELSGFGYSEPCASTDTRRKCRRRCRRRRTLASQLNNSEITNEHFLSALLNQSDGIARPLLEKIGANVDQLQERLRSELEGRPKVHGSAADLRISNELRSVLDSAEKEMSKLKDEFTQRRALSARVSRRERSCGKIAEGSGRHADKLMQGFSRCAVRSA